MPVNLLLLAGLNLPATPQTIQKYLGIPKTETATYNALLTPTPYHGVWIYPNLTVRTSGPSKNLVTHLQLSNGQNISVPIYNSEIFSATAPAIRQPPNSQGVLTLFIDTTKNIDHQWLEQFQTVFPKTSIFLQFTRDTPENRNLICQGIFNSNHTIQQKVNNILQHRLCQARNIGKQEITKMLEQAITMKFKSGDMFISGIKIQKNTSKEIIRELLLIRKTR